MNDAPGTTNDNATPAVQVAEITEILGMIEADESIRVSGRPAANNTRWIFDVVFHGGTLEIFLMDWRSNRKLRPDLMSWNIAPLNSFAHDAKACGLHRDDGVFVLRSLPREGQEFRISIDVLHSANR